VIGAASGKPMVIGVGKPMATVLLFAVLGGMPSDLFGTMVFNAIILSLAADITLLAEGQEALVVGLGLFLVAHLCYGLAFLGAGQVDGWRCRALRSLARARHGWCGANGAGSMRDCVCRSGPMPSVSAR